MFFLTCLLVLLVYSSTMARSVVCCWLGALALGSNMQLQLLDANTNGGQCLDGSPAGFYYGAPPSGKSDLWVISLEGGGACHDEASCLSRANSSLGSSTYWSPQTKPKGLLNDDPAANPDFYSGHHVYLPCML